MSNLLTGIRRWGLVVLTGILAAGLSVSSAKTQTFPDSAYTDVVVLDNGAAVKGKILETVSSKKIVVERIDGQVLELPLKKVATISDLDNYRVIQDSILQVIRENKLEFQPRLDILVGKIYEGDDNGFSAAAMCVAPVIRRVHLGVNLGWEDIAKSRFLLCLLHLRAELGHSLNRPILYLQAGYSAGWHDDVPGYDDGAFTYGGGFGFVFDRVDCVAITGWLGYRHQRFSAEYWGTDSYDFFPNAIGVSIG